jgi:hypothetical protein
MVALCRSHMGLMSWPFSRSLSPWSRFDETVSAEIYGHSLKSINCKLVNIYIYGFWMLINTNNLSIFARLVYNFGMILYQFTQDINLSENISGRNGVSSNRFLPEELLHDEVDPAAVQLERLRRVRQVRAVHHILQHLKNNQ